MKFNKTAKISLIAMTLALLFIAIALFAFFKPVLQYGLARVGFQNATIESANFGLSGTTLKNLRLDDSFGNIGEVQMFATLGDIFNRQLGKVVIRDVKLAYPFGDTGASSAAQGLGALNFFTRTAEFDNVVVEMATPSGIVPVLISGTLLDRGDFYQLSATLRSAEGPVTMAGQLSGEIHKSPARAKLHLELAQAEADMPDLTIKRGGGWISFDITPGSADLPLVNAQLTAGSVRLYQIPLQETAVSISSDAAMMQALVTGKVAGDSGDMTLDARLDRQDAQLDKLSLNVDARLKNLEALAIAGAEGEGSFTLALDAEKDRAAAFADMAALRNLSGTLQAQARKFSLPKVISGATADADLKVAFDPATKTLSLDKAEKPLGFKGKLAGGRSLSVSAAAAHVAWDAAQKVADIDVSGLEYSDADLAAKGGTADIRIYMQEYPVIEGKLTAGEVTSKASPAYFAPLKVDVALNSLSSRPYTTGVSGTVSDKNGLLYVTLSGAHDMVKKSGSLAAKMSPVEFMPGVHELAEVLPVVETYLQEVTGNIGMTARMGWTHNGKAYVTSSGGELFLRNVAARYGDFPIKDINSVLRFDSLTPVTFSKQQLSIGAFTAGLPLTNLVSTLSLDAKNVLSLSSGQAELAKGLILVSPFSMNMAERNADVTLSAQALDLSELFKIAPLDGLTASGIVNGTLPLHIRKSRITLENGLLETAGSGALKYNPQEMPAFLRDNGNQQIADLRTALSAFEYDKLKMTLNGDLTENQRITLNIQGKNPLFYGGHPVNLNLNVEGPLQSVLKYNPSGSTIPDSIKKQLETYESENATAP